MNGSTPNAEFVSKGIDRSHRSRIRLEDLKNPLKGNAIVHRPCSWWTRFVGTGSHRFPMLRLTLKKLIKKSRLKFCELKSLNDDTVAFSSRKDFQAQAEVCRGRREKIRMDQSI
jgi:hypothetical protein